MTTDDGTSRRMRRFAIQSAVLFGTLAAVSAAASIISLRGRSPEELVLGILFAVAAVGFCVSTAAALYYNVFNTTPPPGGRRLERYNAIEQGQPLRVSSHRVTALATGGLAAVLAAGLMAASGRWWDATILLALAIGSAGLALVSHRRLSLALFLVAGVTALTVALFDIFRGEVLTGLAVLALAILISGGGTLRVMFSHQEFHNGSPRKRQSPPHA